jgi:hypothetical protein
MSAFMQGLQTGSQTARGWIDTYEAARKRREEADLKSRREGILTAQPEYSQGYTAEQGQQLEAMASAINPDTGRPYYNVQAGQGGNYSVTPDFTEAQTPRAGMSTGSQYEVAPVELQTTGLGRAGVVAQPIPFNQQRVSNFLGGRVEGDLTPERMELMRSRALANTIADPMERQRALIQMDENERAAQRSAQAAELTGLQINRERDTVTREQKNREATQALSQQLSSGNPPDVAQIYKLASDFGVDPAPLVKLAADNLGLDEKTAKAATEKLVKQINAASTSPDKFRALLDTVADPDPLDNIKPELRETKNGYRVFYGDRAISPEFKESKDMTALQQLAGFYRDTVSGKPMETAITMATLDAKRAAIRASDRSGIRAPDINEYVDVQGNVRLIDVGALPRGKDGQPVLPQGLRKLPTGSASPKDLTPQQQRAFDTLKGTDVFKTAVERGDQKSVRKLLTDNAIPPEAFYGAAATPPGGGDWTATPPPAAPAADKRPQPAVSRGGQQPSDAALRALRERSVGMFTPRGQLEAAAAAGNPAAIQELERRTAGESAAAERNFQMTREQMRGLQ